MSGRLIPGALWSPKHSALVRLRQCPEACAGIWERAAEGFRQNDPHGERAMALLRELNKAKEKTENY